MSCEVPDMHDTTGFQQIGMIRQIERERRILLDQQHAHPVFLIDRAQDAEDFLHDQRREPE